MIRRISAKKLEKKKYKEHPLTGAFRDSFGSPDVKSRWLVYGNSGEGKTEMCMQLAKHFASFTKVAYYSKEQGDSASLQKCAIRNRISEIDRNKLIICFDGNYSDLRAFLNKHKSIRVCIVDSIDYLNLTAEQYKELSEDFPNKTLIFISWKEGKKPKSAAGKAIEYMVDVKIEVKNFVAFPRGRYEGNVPYVIAEHLAKKHHAFLNLQ